MKNYILHSKETRSRFTHCSRLQITQSKLTHRQILHERNYSCEKHSLKFGVRVNKRLHFPLTPTYFPPLPALLLVTHYTPMLLMLSLGRIAAGSSGEYVAESGKCSRWFTRTLKFAIAVKYKFKQFYNGLFFSKGVPKFLTNLLTALTNLLQVFTNLLQVFTNLFQVLTNLLQVLTNLLQVLTNLSPSSYKLMSKVLKHLSQALTNLCQRS